MLHWAFLPGLRKEATRIPLVLVEFMMLAKPIIAAGESRAQHHSRRQSCGEAPWSRAAAGQRGSAELGCLRNQSKQTGSKKVPSHSSFLIRCRSASSEANKAAPCRTTNCLTRLATAASWTGSNHQQRTGSIGLELHGHQGGDDQQHPHQHRPDRPERRPTPQGGADRQPEQPPTGDQPDQLTLEIKSRIAHFTGGHPPSWLKPGSTGQQASRSPPCRSTSELRQAT